uniref:NADH-ubiquinone oxidoreductase chain 2 n=1 Tax=Nemichthys scolopaceus TaxID=118170 RepID=D1YTT2_9TELE|nr:NADH dehydrogenase subunit 2 [Nemichthys scolopaceus]BAI53316.1 NADH dehydrogenase subunit 2 [Nemichthys scolopaceus]
MTPPTTFVMLTTLGLGTTTTFASSHWILAWMGLEISTLAIIPLMAQHHHPRAIEATTKYFLAQATAAALLMFAATSNAWTQGQWQVHQLSDPTAINLAVAALAMKMGIPPLHFWLPEVLQGLDLTTGLILSTWQKMAPMALMYQVTQGTAPYMMVTIGVVSALVGGWGGLNQTQLRKVMAYSSIAHMGWMMVVMKYSPNLMILNLALYMMMTSSAFMALKTTRSTKMNMLAMAWAKSPALTGMTMMTMISLAGLPPLTGFAPKWMILDELTKQELPLIATIMAMSALLSLFFYMRLSYSMTLTISPNTNTNKTSWRTKPNQGMMPLSIVMVASTMLIPLTPALMALAA